MIDVEEIIHAQADLQTALGILRMEIGMLPDGGIQQHNLGFVEDRLAQSLARLHLQLAKAGRTMLHPAQHPEVTGRPVDFWDGRSGDLTNDALEEANG